jgi:ferritin
MLSKTLQDALNLQINRELASAYLYLSMSAHFEHRNLPGFARWMRLQSKEEVEHAMKLFDFVNDRGGRVTLDAVGKPATEFSSCLEVMTHVLEHERKVSASIHNLYALAVKENDYAAQVMLHWFIDEQVEEEKSASDVVERLKMVGDAPAGLLMIDGQLAGRSEEE